jgi:hypothetical protein
MSIEVVGFHEEFEFFFWMTIVPLELVIKVAPWELGCLTNQCYKSRYNN